MAKLFLMKRKGDRLTPAGSRFRAKVQESQQRHDSRVRRRDKRDSRA